MDLIFDISEDELPIFLAETEDHLQVLEEGLVRLEQEDDDPELLQALFRAAHTIKGSAGMIGHKRLVELTHALETLFDGVRKHTLPITTPLIDACLEAVDGLRLLRDEVTNLQPCEMDVAGLVEALTRFKPGSGETAIKSDESKVVKAAVSPTSAPEPPVHTVQPAAPIKIEAEISSTSIATSARAFQVLMALQNAGEVLSMDPTQEQIESASPVSKLTAELKLNGELKALTKDLLSISEVEHIKIDGVSIGDEAPAEPEPVTVQPAQAAEVPVVSEPEPQIIPAVVETETFVDETLQIGEYLLKNRQITSAQLQTALDIQKNSPGEKKLLGNILVQAGVVNQEALDQALAEQINSQKKTISVLQAQETAKNPERSADKTVRTSVERLDKLMNLVGELITDRNRLFQLRHHLEATLRGNEDISTLSDAIMHVGRLTDQLQEEVMHIRMVPVANVFSKFPRMVRDLAQKTGKEVDLVIRGQETELDRSVIEEINDPLIHLMRNAVDHGIETPEERAAAGKTPRGTITLSARHEQGHIILTVEDDGNGISAEKLKTTAVQKGLISELEAGMMDDEHAIDLIFLSGLSTSEKVTDVSGRGVGMDIVRNNIERLNGSIIVETHPGRGSKFEVSLPLTLAIVPTMLVKVGGITFAIPLVTVVETQRLTQRDIQTVRGKPVTMLRDQTLALANLTELFDLDHTPDPNGYLYVVVVRTTKLQIGLVVDALVGEEEVVVKSFGSLIGDIPGISSAAILGDGQIALIVDVQGLFKLAGLH